MGIQLAQRRKTGLQAGEKLISSRHDRTAEQDRQHQDAVATPVKRTFDLTADEIDTRLNCPPVDFGQPVGADEHQHHGGGIDGGGNALREIIADVDAILVVKQGVGVEPMAEFAKQAAGMASGVRAAVADKDHVLSRFIVLVWELAAALVVIHKFVDNWSYPPGSGYPYARKGVLSVR